MILIAAIIFIARSFTRPIRAMARAAGMIATGNLDVTLPDVRSNDEVGKLTEAFRYMSRSLKDYIEKLTETVAVKERIQSELSIARNIQMSILPKNLPRPDGFEFGACIQPARAVGGDFYDAIQFDRSNYGIVIGDISDKVVPAAIFMALTRSLLRAKATLASSPSQVLKRVNQLLFSPRNPH